MVLSRRTEHPEDPRVVLRRAVTDRDADAVTALVAQHWMYLLEDRSITLALALRLSAPDPADALTTAVFAELAAHLKSARRAGATSHRVRRGGERATDEAALRTVIGATVASIAARAEGRAAESLAHVERARAALPVAAARIPAGMLTRMQHHWLRTERMSSGYVTVVDGAEETLRNAVATGQLDVAYRTAGSSALSHALAGRGPASDRAVAEAAALEELIEPWQRSAMGVPLRLATALRLLDRGKGDDAEALLADSRQAERDSDLWALALTVRAQLPAARKDPSRLLAQLEAESASWPSDVRAQPVNSVYLDVARAHLHGMAGHGALAVELLERSAANDAHGVVRVRLAAIRAAEDATAAAGLVEAVLRESRDRPRAAAEMHLLKAARALAEGNEPVASSEFRRAVALALENGIPRSLVVAGPGVLPKLAELAGTNEALDAVAEIDDELVYLDRSKGHALLTPRERAVLLGLMSGRTRAEVARDSFVSVETVRSQLRSAYRKLGVRSLEAAIFAVSEAGIRN
ncbi:helix-turn-helix transcriptional regulator [Agromyces mediolanus]|uniref:response regulator transcription factor n=1 Tax=Agromyces mediolanus TaxID=41986 RepID=UPI0038345C8A